MAWSYHQRKISLAIAAQIFIAAGTVILYVINLFFTQRLMRARLPHIGWHKPFKIFVPGIFVACTIGGLIMVIIAVIQSFYTLNPNTHRIDRDIQLAVLCYFTLSAFVPIPIVALMLILHKHSYVDKFGSGRFRTKIAILVSTSALLTVGAGFRCGTSFVAPVPTMAPTPWYFSKACFYCFDLLTDFIPVVAYAFLRVDRRFYVPPGAHGAGQYSAETMQEKPRETDREVFTLNEDGRTLSLPDGRTFSLGDRRTFSMADRSSLGFGARSQPHDGTSIDDSESAHSQSYMTVNRKSGRYELKDVPDMVFEQDGTISERRESLQGQPDGVRAPTM